MMIPELTQPDAQELGVESLIEQHLAADDGTALTSLLDPLPRSEALREVLNLSAAERDKLLAIVSAELAAELIEEAPTELAGDLIERLEAARAAEIIEELHSGSSGAECRKPL